MFAFDRGHMMMMVTMMTTMMITADGNIDSLDNTALLFSFQFLIHVSAKSFGEHVFSVSIHRSLTEKTAGR